MAKLKEFLIGIKAGQKKFGENIALVVNTLLLSIVYFLGIGFTSIIAQILGKRFLEIKPEKDAKTYWKNLNLSKKPLEEYYRQF